MTDNTTPMFRQGDLLFIRVAELPKDAEKASKTLAIGEATGHKHRATGMLQVFKQPLGPTFLKGPGQIVHEEHAIIDIPEGVYEMRRQREYVAGTSRTKVRLVKD